MKKIKLTIVAAGLMLATGTLYSCKKEAAPHKQSTTKSSSSKARVLTDAEATTAINEINAFIPYVEAVSANPNAQVPGTLPTELSDDDLVKYLENGLNFTYTAQEDKLSHSIQNTQTITISKNANQKVGIQVAAQKFIDAYNYIKQQYLAINSPNDEKVFKIVDVSVASTSNSTITLTLNSVYEWGYEPATLTPAAAAITAPTGTWAGFGDLSGNNWTAVDPTGVAGSIEILHMVLRANIGGYLFLGSTVPPKTKFSRYLVTNVTYQLFGMWPHASGADLPTSAPNPWVASNWGTGSTSMPYTIKDYNSLVFYGANPTADGFAHHLPADLLNYMLNWNEWVLKQKETATGKNIVDLVFTFHTISTSSYHQWYYIMNTHYANVKDLLAVPTLPTKYKPITGPIASFI